MDCLTHLLTCPICHLRFAKIGHSMKCATGHTFDIAKEGYVNLATGKMPGDSKEMLLARRAFLERGYYLPLSDMLNNLVINYLHSQEQELGVLPHVNILDAGCGEGYYLGRLQQQVVQQFSSLELCTVGVDISKEAVRMAAKQYKQARFVVANIKERLVFANDSLHVLLNIFAPRNIEEFARVLMPGGLCLVVIPAPTHLEQLRSTLHLLDIEENKQQKVVEQFTDHFELLGVQNIAQTIQLPQKEIELAVRMTPNNWHKSDKLQEAIAAIETLETEIAFTCLVLRKKGPPLS